MSGGDFGVDGHGSESDPRRGVAVSQSPSTADLRKYRDSLYLAGVRKAARLHSSEFVDLNPSRIISAARQRGELVVLLWQFEGDSSTPSFAYWEGLRDHLRLLYESAEGCVVDGEYHWKNPIDHCIHISAKWGPETL